MTKQITPTPRFVKGDDYQDPGMQFTAYGINDNEAVVDQSITDHANKIEVYGDEKLRDLILKLLNK